MRKQVIIADEIQLDGEFLKVESQTAKVLGSSLGRAPQKRVPGSARGLVTVPDDFDAPIDDFRNYL